jgi:hypothetical protein
MLKLKNKRQTERHAILICEDVETIVMILHTSAKLQRTEFSAVNRSGTDIQQSGLYGY